MKEVTIKLNGVDSIKKFNNVVSGLCGDIDLVSGRYVVDAKSIMGIFSLDISKPITCRINALDQGTEESALSAIQEWIVK